MSSDGSLKPAPRTYRLAQSCGHKILLNAFRKESEVLLRAPVGGLCLWGLEMPSDGNAKSFPEGLMTASNRMGMRFYFLPSDSSLRSYFVLQLETCVCGDSKCLQIVIRSPAPRSYRLPRYVIRGSKPFLKVLRVCTAPFGF